MTLSLDGHDTGCGSPVRHRKYHCRAYPSTACTCCALQESDHCWHASEQMVAPLTANSQAVNTAGDLCCSAAATPHLHAACCTSTQFSGMQGSFDAWAVQASARTAAPPLQVLITTVCIDCSLCNVRNSARVDVKVGPRTQTGPGASAGSARTPAADEGT